MANGDNGQGPEELSDADKIAQALQTEQKAEDKGSGDPKYFFAEGVAGEGDPPEWFKSDKYKTVAEQAKAYKEIESKLGAFKGAPEKYDVELSQELVDAGFTVSTEDPIFESAVEFAKKSNMSQEGFNGMMNIYASTKMAEAQALEEYKQEQIKLLGDNGEVRLKNIGSYLRSNLGPEMAKALEPVVVDAKTAEALEKLISMTMKKPVTPSTLTGNSQGITAEDVRKMQFETDEHGRRRIQFDPEFKARYDQAMKAVYGDGHYSVSIGK